MLSAVSFQLSAKKPKSKSVYEKYTVKQERLFLLLLTAYG